jgi:hypothetical protein
MQRVDIDAEHVAGVVVALVVASKVREGRPQFLGPVFGV